MAIGDIKTFDYVYGVNGADLTLKIIAFDNGDGTCRIEVKCLDGYADINALYWGDDSGPDALNFDLGTKKDNSLSMNGAADETGTKITDWDGGITLSAVGLGQPVVTFPNVDGVSMAVSNDAGKDTYLTKGETLVLDGVKVSLATIENMGVRATSTLAGGGSIKGVDGSADPTTLKISVDDACVVEGTSVDGLKAIDFKINLEKAYPYDVWVSYETLTNGTADGDDFVSKTDKVFIAANATSATVTVMVNMDGLVEADDTFTLHLTKVEVDMPGDGPYLTLPVGVIYNDAATGTIKNDDHAPIANDFKNEDCGTEAYGNHAAVDVVGNVLFADVGDPDGDATSITRIIYQGQDVGPADGSAIALGNLGILKVQADGAYSFTYTGPGIPDGADSMVEISFSYQVADQYGNTVSDGSLTDSVGIETICIDAAPKAPDLIPPDCPPDGVELLANNGFELDIVPSDWNTNYLVGTPSGWTNAVGAPLPEVVNENYNGHILTGFGADQDQWLDSASTPGDLHISQSLDVATGEEFHLSMSIAAEFLTFGFPGQYQAPEGSSVDLVWNGEVAMHIELDDFNGVSDVFKLFETEVIGGDGTDTLEIVSHGQAGVNTGYAIDYVSLQGCEEETAEEGVETMSPGIWKTNANGDADLPAQLVGQSLDSIYGLDEPTLRSWVDNPDTVSPLDGPMSNLPFDNGFAFGTGSGSDSLNPDVVNGNPDLAFVRHASAAAANFFNGKDAQDISDLDQNGLVDNLALDGNSAFVQAYIDARGMAANSTDAQVWDNLRTLVDETFSGQHNAEIESLNDMLQSTYHIV